MWIVRVKSNINGSQTHRGEFKTKKEASAWSSKHQKKGSWGLPARTVPKFPIAYPEVLVKKEIVVDGVDYVKLKAEFVVTLVKLEEDKDKELAAKYIARKVVKIRKDRAKADLVKDFLILALDNPLQHGDITRAAEALNFSRVSNLVGQLTETDIAKKDMDILLIFLED